MGNTLRYRILKFHSNLFYCEIDTSWVNDAPFQLLPIPFIGKKEIPPSLRPCFQCLKNIGEPSLENMGIIGIGIGIESESVSESAEN